MSVCLMATTGSATGRHAFDDADDHAGAGCHPSQQSTPDTCQIAVADDITRRVPVPAEPAPIGSGGRGKGPAVRARPRVLAVPPQVAAIGHHQAGMYADAAQPAGDDGVPARADGQLRRTACPIGHGRLTSGLPPRHRKTQPTVTGPSRTPVGVASAGRIVEAGPARRPAITSPGRYQPTHGAWLANRPASPATFNTPPTCPPSP